MTLLEWVYLTGLPRERYEQWIALSPADQQLALFYHQFKRSVRLTLPNDEGVE